MTKKPIVIALGLAVLGLNTPVNALEGYSKIAKSKKLGVEIQGKHLQNGSWCGSNVDLLVTVDSPEVTDNGVLASLVKKLGGVLTKECPQTQAAAFTIVSSKENGLIETGGATIGNAWTYAKTSVSPEVAATESAPSEAYGVGSATEQTTVTDSNKPVAEVSDVAPAQGQTKPATEVVNNEAAVAQTQANPSQTQSQSKTVASSSVSLDGNSEKVSQTPVSEVVEAKPVPQNTTADAQTQQPAVVAAKESSKPDLQPTVIEKPLAEKSLEEIYADSAPVSDRGVGGEFNMIGDWRGKFSCKKWNTTTDHEYTLSVYRQDGEKYQAYINWDKFGYELGGIFKGEGYYIVNGNVLSFKTTQALLTGQAKGASLQGLYDKEQKVFVGETSKGCTSEIITKISDEPTVANRISKSESFYSIASEWANARGVRGTELGRMARGEVKFPGCKAVDEWANAYPLDIAKTVSSRNKINLHFMDELSVKYFGSPAYYWDENERKFLRQQLRTCESKIGRDRSRFINNKLLGNYSYSGVKQLNDRKEIDAQIINYSLGWIQTGASDQAIYDEFTQRLLDQTITRNLSRYALGSDVELVKKEVARYRDFYALRILKKYAAEVEALKNVGNPFLIAEQLKGKVKSIEGLESVVSEKTNIQKSIVSAVESIISLKVTARTAELKGVFSTFQEVSDARTKNDQLVSSFASYNDKKYLDELELALIKSVQSSADRILQSELEQLKSIEIESIEDSQGIAKYLSMMLISEKAFKDAALLDQLKEYSEEADDSRKEFLSLTMDFLDKGIESLNVDDLVNDGPNEWESKFQSLDELPEMIQEVYGAYPVREDVKDHLSDLKENLIEKLSEASKALVAKRFKTDSAMSPQEFQELIDAANAPQYEFAQKDLQVLNKVQTDFAVELMDSSLEKQEEIAEEVNDKLEEFISQNSGRNLYRQWGEARRFALDLKPLLEEHDELEDLQEAWQEIQDELQLAACKTSYDMGDEAELKVIAGTGTTTFENMVCAMKISRGIELVEFESPGVFGDDFYTLRFKTNEGSMVMKMIEAKSNNGDDALLATALTSKGESKQLDREQWEILSVFFLGEAEREARVPFGARDLAGDDFSMRIIGRLLSSLF